MSIQTREIQYTAPDGTHLVGFFAYPTHQQPVAGVLIAHEWWGRNAFTEQRAIELAEHGYAALAIDMYGDKATTEIASEANAMMMATFAQDNIIIDRVTAGLNTLAQQAEVDATRLAAIGFCYGGKVVLDLARSGANLKAVVTFHGNLSTAQAAEKGKIKAEILVNHGELDSMVTLENVEQFRQEMQNADVKHHISILKDAKHGFTNPLADERAKANGVDLAFNAQAQQQSFADMYALFVRTLND